ncbi:hypothetical protein [Gordonia sp. NPDC003376]
MTTYRGLIDSGQCNGRCLLAEEEGECSCSCGGRHHGELAEIPLGGFGPRSQGVMRYGVHNPSAERYGRKYWIVGLADGREMGIKADSLDASDGILSAIGDEGYALLILRPAYWMYAYAASVVDGTPVCVDNLDAPDAPKKKRARSFR